MKKIVFLLTAILAVLSATAQKSLPMPQWTHEPAILKGTILGYEKGKDMKVELLTGMAYDYRNLTAEAEVNDDGTFRMEVPMYATRQARIGWIGPLYRLLVLTAGDSLSVTIDLKELKENSLGANPLTFTGAMAKLNNEITTEEAWEICNHYFKTDEKGRTTEEYSKAVSDWRDRDLRRIKKSKFSLQTKEFLRLRVETNSLIELFRVKQNNGSDHLGTEIMRRAMPKGFNTLKLAYTNRLDAIAAVMRDAIFCDTTVTNKKKAELMELQRSGMSQEELTRKYEEMKTQFAFDILGSDRGAIQDCLLACPFSIQMEKESPLTESQIATLNSMENKFVRNYYLAINRELKDELERRKLSNDYTIHKTPENSGEEFLSEVCGQFDGKVILIDFWTTWCGPCRAALEQFKDAHKRLTEKGLVTLYLTDNSSPENEWRDKASGMHGHHYRLTSQQREDIFRKFSLSGWPSYVIIDRQSRYIYRSTGFDEKTVTETIEKALAE